MERETYISKPEESESACLIDQHSIPKKCTTVLTASIIASSSRSIPPARDRDPEILEGWQVVVVDVAQKWSTFSKVSGPGAVLIKGEPMEWVLGSSRWVHCTGTG